MENLELVTSRVDAARKLFQQEETFDSQRILGFAYQLVQAFNEGRTIAFVGNGGSAAEAMHLAAEFTGKCVLEHRPLNAICLNESQSALTAVANDFGVDYIFSRQVEAHLKKGDLLVALSTSGKSANILKAIQSAKELGVFVHLWMGDFECSIDEIEIWKVSARSTPRIQEVHLVWGHLLAEVVEILISTDKF